MGLRSIYNNNRRPRNRAQPLMLWREPSVELIIAAAGRTIKSLFSFVHLWWFGFDLVINHSVKIRNAFTAVLLYCFSMTQATNPFGTGYSM